MDQNSHKHTPFRNTYSKQTQWTSRLLIALLSLQLSQAALAAEEKPLLGELKATTASDAALSEDNNSASDPSTLLSPGFLVQMQSTTDPSLNGTFRIQFDGQLILPYSVTQNIFENETPITLGQLKERCLKAYRPFFSKQPSIQLSIKERKFWIETKGLVQKPGSYLISPTNTLDQIISMTGGVTQTPAPKFARIENGSKLFWVNIADFYKQGRVEGMPQWSGGEKIVFQTEAPEGASTGLLEGSRKINILGEVKSPGEQSFTKETDVYAYLVKTGGPTQAADLDRVELIRKDPTTGLNTPIALGPISSIKDIQDSDIMIVHAQRQTTFEKVLQSSAIIASVVSSIALTYIAIHQFKGK